ncbi:hypothetical protein C476_08438 [Natrinema limicola JCM 13563]|uniref:Uncharacterized protein n=1 Tax=Natrinema limicola JCM 13563 TaxID=1230457 RepID=M0CEW2_9EURY|nr:hypothetical protein C476_08438 [Natrinema limicola JCM 13563]
MSQRLNWTTRERVSCLQQEQQTTAVIEPETLTSHRHAGNSAMLVRTHTGFPVKRYEQPVAISSDAVECTPYFR